MQAEVNRARIAKRTRQVGQRGTAPLHGEPARRGPRLGRTVSGVATLRTYMLQPPALPPACFHVHRGRRVVLSIKLMSYRHCAFLILVILSVVKIAI